MSYQKTIEKIEQELKKYIGNKKAVIGISGGIDSAVVASLCVKALGKENVLGVSMPYGNQNTEDAKLVVKNLGVESKEINIKEIVDRFNFLEINKITKGNIMARTRMIILYLFANQLNGLVIGTGNKTEIEIGYFTKYGDGGVDLLPIGELYKTEIFEIAGLLNVPQKIIKKMPTAGLYGGQTDEGEIGASYQEIDTVLKGKIMGGEVYKKIMGRKKSSEHKRRTPIIFKIRKKNEI